VSGLYVFGLAGQKAAPFVAAGHRIEFVKADDVYAAVERVSRPPAVSEETLRTQHEVVAHIAGRVEALLPARFGAFVDARELRALVAGRREAILEALALVQGRTQMTARLLGPELPAAVVPAETRATTGAEYLANRRATVASPPMPAALRAVADAVRGIVVTERAEAGRGRVIATLYHLLDRDLVADYKAALAPIPPLTGDLALSVTGPWPPFAFAPDLWE
jgi:hypothetical protein